MTATATPLPVPLSARAEQLFPTLTDAQMKRMADHGRRRTVREGEILLDIGEPSGRVYVVVTGVIEVLGYARETEMRIAEHHPGQFTGEVNTLSGRPGIAHVRVAEAGEL